MPLTHASSRTTASKNRRTRALQAKGDSDPASWLPPNKAIRCSYVERFAMVSLKYAMPVTPADKPSMLSQCGPG